MDILHRNRVGETHRLTQLLTSGGIRLRVGAGNDIDDVARQQPEHKKDQDAHPEQCRDEQQDPGEDVLRHEVLPHRTYSSVTQAVRSPVLKSVYETYMPSTRLLATWNLVGWTV